MPRNPESASGQTLLLSVDMVARNIASVTAGIIQMEAVEAVVNYSDGVSVESVLCIGVNGDAYFT